MLNQTPKSAAFISVLNAVSLNVVSLNAVSLNAVSLNGVNGVLDMCEQRQLAKHGYHIEVSLLCDLYFVNLDELNGTRSVCMLLLRCL